MDNIRSKFSLIVLVFIYVLNIYTRWIHLPDNPIHYDVFGYYLYLPLSFIYNDLGLQHKEILDQLITQYSLTSGFYQAAKGPLGFLVMKYSMGMAVYYSPGFFVAHLVAFFSEYPADGFSAPYKWALIINSTLYAFIGLFILRKVLLRFFNDKITSLVLLLIFVGTNYFHYSTTSAEMPHNYLFTMYALVLWLTMRWHDAYRMKYAVFLAVVISIMVLARPSEIVAIIIPVFWNIHNKDSFNEKIRMIKNNWHQVLVFACVMVLIGSVQMVYWKIYSGSFLYMSYINPGEGFEFLKPYILNVLFSFRKGWLIYTPLMLFAIWGFYYLFRSNKKIFVSLFLFFIINLYIISSWSCWWYADGFGHRAFIQSYAVMSLPLGYFIQQINRKSTLVKFIVYSIFTLLILLNLFQTWQVRHSILSSSRMTLNYYIKSFGKTEINWSDKYRYLLVNRSKQDSIEFEKRYTKSLLKSINFEDFDLYNKYISDSIIYDGHHSFRIDSTIKYYSILKSSYNDLTSFDHAWLRLNMQVYIAEKFNANPVTLTFNFFHEGKPYHYKSIELNRLYKNDKIKQGRWNKIKLDYLTPEVRSKNDTLVILLHNRGNTDFYLDHISVDLFEPIQYKLKYNLFSRK